MACSSMNFTFYVSSLPLKKRLKASEIHAEGRQLLRMRKWSYGSAVCSERIYPQTDGFGGLVVSMLASGNKVCRFKPGRSRWIFTGVKILSMPSSGEEVKESVPCPSFAACQRT